MDQATPARLSAAVISYNREAIIPTCLKSLAFADEVILVDKSSTDGTRDRAAGLVDRIVQVPWSPVVEPTRVFAMAQCSHDWILLLDDDECMSPAAGAWIMEELRHPRAGAYSFLFRQYLLGIHDEAAYSWPARLIRLFHRDAVTVSGTTHSLIAPKPDRLYDVPLDGEVCIHHFSHVDAAQWIEKTNRYTSQVDRNGVGDAPGNLFDYAHERLTFWAAQGAGPATRHTDATAVLRAVYDMVDRIKAWEQQRGETGAEMFAAACRVLEQGYAETLAPIAKPRQPPAAQASPGLVQRLLGRLSARP